MAGNSEENKTKLSKRNLSELSKLVWGSNLKEEVFQRWSQGFIFSEDESTALQQFEGGPCAVIAPVQAFILLNAIFKHEGNWRNVTKDVSNSLMIKAMCEILKQCSSNGYYILYVKWNNDEVNNDKQKDDSSKSVIDSKMTEEENFHSLLRLIKAETLEELEVIYHSKIEMLQQPYGVLSFLYSVILTKGIDQIKNEMEDPNEPLVDGIHGHGSQSLINLMLTGVAVSNVWDNEKDISGLKLKGISKQSRIGFLTLLEHLRYCEVGWFLKCPEFPIWIVGSEVHLTVLFAKEKSLVSPETNEAAARRIFKTFDPEGNNFISTILLGDLLQALDLFCETDYVEIMKQKLDSDGCGIILLNSFMQEFYPNENKRSLPDSRSFTLYHYNGLKRSCPEGKVKYQEGHAVICEDDDIKYVSDLTPIQKCLQTKWPGIEVEWVMGMTPSII